MRREQLSGARQSLVVRNQRCLSRLYLSNTSPHFRKLGADLGKGKDIPS
jgi:hypothetical protein